MEDSKTNPRYLLLTTVGALGVVFGDIGTSPLYAFRETFLAAGGLAVDEASVMGILSLMFWSLVVVISVKYLGFLMRADNEGEGGIMALTALAAGREMTSWTRAKRKLLLLGHFGRRPIRLAWFTLVFPALLLNYFGQGGLIISRPETIENPFYRMAPGWALVPLIILATMATVIASQALISAAYSLTMQAIQLGYLPRLKISHTSPREFGQVYIGTVNWLLMLATIGTVFAFGSSSNLAAAYGVAVTTTMVITTLLFYIVMRRHWRWSPLLVSVQWVSTPRVPRAARARCTNSGRTSFRYC